MSLNNYCRLCFEEKENYSSFENETAKMLNSLTKIQIEPNEKKSIFICVNCLKDLKTAYNIQQKILKAATRHQEELLADFLIENHDELRNELLIHYTFNELQLVETADSEITNKTVPADDSQAKFTCETCPAKFQLSAEFLKHVEQHKTRKCNSCAEDVAIEKYNEHITEHKFKLEETDVLCEKCGEIFPDAEAHDVHMKNVHIGEHVCEACGADFFKIDELQQHFKSKHSSMKSFLCDVCHEEFALRYVLQLHKLQHIHDSPFACELCPRTFKYNCSLKIHLKTKHNNDNSICEAMNLNH